MALPARPAKGQVNGYDQFEAWATGVSALAENALPLKGQLGTQHLDDLKDSGIWYQASGSLVTTEKGYPIPNAVGCCRVIAPNSVNGVIQEYETYAITSGARVTMSRRWTSINSVYSWSPWYATPTQRVDESAGRAIYTWDYVNNREQLVYYDSGVRNLATYFPEGTLTAGLAYLYRDGREVTLVLQDAVFGAAAGIVSLPVMPPGFVSYRTESGVATVGSAGAPQRVQVQTNGVIRIWGVTAGNSINASIRWRTNDGKPSVLPGAAIGTIPNA